MAKHGAYYNEHDPKAAAWLRALIQEGLIADGEVDTRSIVEVAPADVSGFAQAHFFAGIGGWSYALRLAGWADDRAVWTGSCPCQSFSAAGKQQGTNDPRHLWPVWADLIRECRPAVILGEQVEAAVRHGWLDLVQRDLETEGYACGAVVLGAHSVGAPHLRQRLWFVAESERGSAERRGHDVGTAPGTPEGGTQERERLRDDARDGGHASAVAHDTQFGRREERALGRGGGAGDGAEGRTAGSESGGDARELADDDGSRRGARRAGETGDGGDAARVEPAGLRAAGELGHHHPGSQGRGERRDGPDQCAAGASSEVRELAHPNGGVPGHRVLQRSGRHGLRPEDPAPPLWADCDWIPCRDGKWRPVEPGTFPLAHGVPARVGRLRGYGNAINPYVAAEVIAAFMESR